MNLFDEAIKAAYAERNEEKRKKEAEAAKSAMERLATTIEHMTADLGVERLNALRLVCTEGRVWVPGANATVRYFEYAPSPKGGRYRVEPNWSMKPWVPDAQDFDAENLWNGLVALAVLYQEETEAERDSQADPV